MKHSKSLKSLSRASLMNSPSSLTATTQVSKGVQYPPVPDEIYKTFSTKNANGIAINYEEYDNDSSSDISTRPILSRQASATVRNRMKSPNTYTFINNNNGKVKLTNCSPYNKEIILSSKTTRNKPTSNIQPFVKCTKECKRNLLKKYSYYKYLNISTLDKLTSNKLDIGFLKSNPFTRYKNMTKHNTKSQDISSRKSNPLTSTNASKKKDPKKIFLANINKTKQSKLISLISKLNGDKNEKSESSSKENMSKHIRNRKGSFDSNKNEFLSLKHFSIMDKFILRMLDPDEMIEDYMLDGNKPFDRFTKFKKVCVRERKRLYGLVNDLHKAPSVNQEQIKVYISMIKKIKMK